MAIELAAARTRSLALDEIADRLDTGLRLLSWGRKAKGRQDSLANAIDWSSRLLDDDERSLVARLSVCNGPTSLASVHAVTAVGSDELDTLDLLDDLTAKSMVQADPTAGQYLLLEPIRQHARAKLTSSGEEAETRRRHARHFLHLAEAAGIDADTTGLSSAALADRDNLAAAAQWAQLDVDDINDVHLTTEERCRILLALGDRQVLSRDPGAAATLNSAAWLAADLGDVARTTRAATADSRSFTPRYARAQSPEKLAVLEASLLPAGDEDSAERALLLSRLGCECTFDDAERCADLCREAIETATRIQDPRTQAIVLANYYSAVWEANDDAQPLLDLASELRDPALSFAAASHSF